MHFRLLLAVSLVCLIGFSGSTGTGGELLPESKLSPAAKPGKFPLLRTWMININGNLNVPYTDLRYNDGGLGTSDPINENTFGAGLGITKMLNHAVGIRVSGSYAPKVVGVTNPADFTPIVDLSGNYEEYRGSKIRENVYFETSLIQAAVQMYWNITNSSFGINRLYKNLNAGTSKNRKWGIYALVGGGFAQYQTTLYKVSDASEYTDVRAHAEAQNVLTFPMALGLKYKLGFGVDLGIEGSTTTFLSDDLDLLEAHEAGWIQNDQVSNLSLTLTFKPGSKSKDKESYDWVNETGLLANNFARQETIISRLRNDLDSIARDSDDDGVANFYDKEPNTPAGYAVNVRGESLDSDFDGVVDAEDMEIYTLSDAEVDELGVAMDGDSDGVPDVLDREANTPSTAQVDVRGVTIKAGGGSGGYLPGLPPVFFDVGSWDIKPQYYGDLFALARILKDNAGTNLVLIGNADQNGDNKFNLELGRKRALAIRDYLTDNFQIEKKRISYESKGEEVPISKNNQAMNRRVDFDIK